MSWKRARRKNKLKMHRKLLLVIVFLLLAGGSLAAYGMFSVTSNTVHVDMGYAVALSFSVSKNHVSLTAAVTSNGSPGRAGIDVDFYYSLNSGEWTYFATELTNHRGVARVRYTITVSGEYDFKAMVSTP
jgi:hypothetical protein